MWKTKVVDTSNEDDIFSFQRQNGQSNTSKFIKNMAFMVVIMSLCTLFSMFLDRMGNIESDIVMVYLLGITFFSYLASGYWYSFLASICGVLLYNFFFTEPYFTFQVYRHDYLITFFIMFVVGLFTSMLTIKIKLETFLAEEREKRIKALYYIGRKLLGVKNSAYLAEVSAKEIAKQFSANVLVQFINSSGSVHNRYVEGKDVFTDDKERVFCLEAYQSGNPCGFGTKLFPQARAYYLPVIGQGGALGMIGISLPEAMILTNVQTKFLDTIASQIAAVLERERLYEKQEKTQIQVQRERLRADMLRAISHDLRTPLTGIMGSASTVIDNFETISDDVKKTFLHNIYDDAYWLNEMVENILNMTRFDEGKIKLNIEQEAAEEIIAEAISRVKKHAGEHKILAEMPPGIVLLNVDGVLITQVLVNLLENAINYTPDGSEIVVALSQEKNYVVFEVSDNGPGISEENLPHMFERFYSRNEKCYGARRGTGLGLSLCKSIIEAHRGNISIKNNKPHGTVVKFCVPAKEEVFNAALNSDCR